MSDFGDLVFPVARKAHVCEWCGEAIPVGLKHPRFAGRWENTWQAWRMHYECHEAADLAGSLDDGFTPHDNERPEQAAS